MRLMNGHEDDLLVQFVAGHNLARRDGQVIKTFSTS